MSGGGKGVGVSMVTLKTLYGTIHPSPRNRTDTTRKINERFMRISLQFVIPYLYQADVTNLSCLCHGLVTFTPCVQQAGE